MSSSDVASLAGTWVGAGVALMALITIIGPILVWRASLTKRHKALAAIGRNNNRYLSDGIPFWPGIRFFRVLRMPQTAVLRNFTDEEWGDFDLGKLKTPPESPATWVQFGACLEAYGLRMKYTKDSAMHDGHFALPVHRSYLFNFLVLGRYREKELKKRPHTLGERRMSLRLSLSRSNTQSLRPSWSLHGMTGTLLFETKSTHNPTLSGKVQFTQSLENCETKIPRDKLSRLSILLLVYGCLHLASGRYICCIIGQYDHPQVSPDSDSESDSGPRFRVASIQRRLTMSTYGSETQRKADKVLEKLKIAVYILQPVPLEEGDFPLGVESCSMEVYVLHPVESTPVLQEKLLELAGMTFVPPVEPYVRVYTDDKGRSSRSRLNSSELTEWNLAFLKRESAQLFAFALLTMPWSPRNYVLSKGDNKSLVGVLLSEAGASCVRLLLRLKNNAGSLSMELAKKTKLLAAIDKALSSKFDVPDLCDLDERLASLQHDVVELPLMVGVLVLTNEEYRELIYQSTRHLDKTAKSPDVETEFDLDTGNVTVSGPFGVKHVFVVDLAELTQHLPDHVPSQRRIFRIDHATILLAAVKAHLRSLLFSECIDGSDIQRVMNYEEDVYLMS
ncbi:hypothetical protein PV08_00292 [Exophiala spinifera]|uniref:Uncharacterized protein n=1 Tax=Exophiala spinifera TaxID=91928 RepID=A0A0D2BL82_9EURO|nr:uncharacterized protein PV08_00292 [Exophiala spinifera]KIW19718.1 hypothetical protein PV08_00292 [Exophiala spinifera]